MLVMTALGWSLGVQAEDPTEGFTSAIEACHADLGAGAAAAGLDALANLGSMFGTGKRSRILGHTVNDMSDGNRSIMMVSPR
ncbi:MAG: hypothetical protein CMQ05_03600 [Gammaproteobacteria bacterium]|nr:hypothetical protein [Gammaproteobacteria bacterium]|tara:strand:- start:341 stop:586 length:246 start_codon:yes stop_codon:yes gene_type:complete